ncbi:hypothetical protein M9H77_17751 [Catharanthus roseus]|uniref:Uncharacterized protein n=1 Tax=Catharanthus roseus TaxID=4058 RepID=A0ACC0B5U3_CATRO|nr:hypothetical protein M9H77_17751 [Catharanthus roseus]
MEEALKDKLEEFQDIVIGTKSQRLCKIEGVLKDPPRNDEGDQPRDGESGLSIRNGQGRAKYTMELRMHFQMLCGSKNRAHPITASTLVASTSDETTTTPVETASTLASIPLETSLSPATSSKPPGTSTPPVVASTPQRP